MPDIRVPFYALNAQHEQIRKEAVKVFEEIYNGHWFILGDKLKKFEQEYANFTGSSYCAGVSSGLDAIYLSLRALGIDRGDEVIVPAHTFIATWLAVSRTGATPVPVEPDLQTFNIDSKKIESAITSKTKAIIVVHLYGHACAMDEVLAVSERYGIPVLEDNAQAQGSSWKNKKTGSWGKASATSFYPTKNLGALGNGGAITTSDEQVIKAVRELRNYGSSEKYRHDSPGINSRLDELQASLLSLKLQYLQMWNDQRISLAKLYSDNLKDVADVQLPYVAMGAVHVFHLYVIRCRQRDRLQKFLLENGVVTLLHYPTPPHLQNAYKGLNYKAGDFPITEEIAATCLSLPVWPGMPMDSVKFVTDTIKNFYKKYC